MGKIIFIMAVPTLVRQHLYMEINAPVDNNVCWNVMTFRDKWHVGTQISLSTRAIASRQITFVYDNTYRHVMTFRAKRHIHTQNPLSTRAPMEMAPTIRLNIFMVNQWRYQCGKDYIISLDPRKCGSAFRSIIFKPNTQNATVKPPG